MTPAATRLARSAEIEHRHDLGQSVSEIATAMGLTYGAVHNVLRHSDRIVQPKSVRLTRLRFLVRKGLIP